MFKATENLANEISLHGVGFDNRQRYFSHDFVRASCIVWPMVAGEFEILIPAAFIAWHH